MCGAYGRSAETALPMRNMGACDQTLLHMVRVRCPGGRWVQEDPREALWKMCSEPSLSSHGTGDQHAVGCRWAVSYLLAQCYVELRVMTQRLSTESVLSLDLSQRAESLSTCIFMRVGYAATGQTL